jgi:OmpA-OmpF porin, OOP family
MASPRSHPFAALALVLALGAGGAAVTASADQGPALYRLYGEAGFAFDRAELSHGGRVKLTGVAPVLQEFLARSPRNRIEVHGHTDSVGSAAYNYLLSDRRANAVRDYLIEQGLPGNRILAVGAGKDRPIETNDTAEGRTHNRRVDILMITPS